MKSEGCLVAADGVLRRETAVTKEMASKVE